MRQKDSTAKEARIWDYPNCELFIINLDSKQIDRNDSVFVECEELERKLWNAKSDFFDYLKEMEFLILARKRGKLVGFALFSHHVFENIGTTNLNEVMVAQEIRKQGYANVLIWAVVYSSVFILSKNRAINRYVFACASVNPIIINHFHRFRNYFTNSTFKPNDFLTENAFSFIERFNYKPIDKSSPWFLSGLYPNAIKNPKEIDITKLKINLPDGFDFFSGGDAVLLMGKQIMILSKLVSFLVFNFAKASLRFPSLNRLIRRRKIR